MRFSLQGQITPCHDLVLEVGQSSSVPCATFHFRQPLQPSAGVLVSAVSPSGVVSPSLSVKMQSRKLDREFQVGDELTITGKVLKSVNTSFSVNLCVSDELNGAIFHFNPRLYKTWSWGPRLVMNTMKDGRWLEEVNVTPFDIKPGEEFTLKIKHGEQGFEVDMSNGFLYRYLHRRKDLVRFVLFCGDIQVEDCKHNTVY